MHEDIKKRLLEIKNYCEQYHEWPVRYKYPQNDQENKSLELVKFLKSLRYNYNDQSKMRHSDLLIEGVSALDFLNKLYLEYKLKADETKIINKILEVEDYCLKYKLWPENHLNPQNEQEEKSSELAIILKKMGYNQKDQSKFKYGHIIINGESAKDFLDKLFDEYKIKADEKLIVAKVMEIKQYCLDYNTWPQNIKLKGNESLEEKEKIEKGRSLYNWLLRVHYGKADFKYRYLKDENGVEIVEILDSLYDIYKLSIEDKVNIIVLEIEDYCLKYNTWPQPLELKGNESQSLKEKIEKSAKLYAWLIRSKYGKSDFLYKDLINKDGIRIEEILDALYQEYKDKAYINSIFSVVEDIKDYCLKYNTWPHYIGDDTLDQEMLEKNNRLYNWLSAHHYGKDDFQYGEIRNEQNESVKEILDSLYNTYNRKSREMDIILEIEDYCLEYGEWPRDVRPKGNETLSEKIKLKRGSRLYSWLLRNKYKTDEFVFLDVEYKDGVSVKEKLDLLYSQYYNCNAKKSKKNNSSVTDEIEKYCSKYAEWPELKINPQNEQERKSNFLYNWLLNAGYPLNFRFRDLKDQNGDSIGEKLDFLYFQYCYFNTNRRKEFILSIIDEIEKYCLKYMEWPELKTSSQNKWENESNFLYNWLLYSGYPHNFKFRNLKDQNGINVKEKLDKLFLWVNDEARKKGVLHAKEKVLLIEEYCKTNNEWVRSIREPHNDSERLCDSLSKWLRYYGYFDNNFRFKNIIGDDDITLQNKLDLLYKEYGQKISKRKFQMLKEMVSEIANYCEKYNEFPKFFHKASNPQHYISNNLVRWLRATGYYKKDFKYQDIADEDGILLQDKIDLLRSQYKLISERNIRKSMLLKVRDYCLKYNTFPARTINPETEEETEAATLYNWLNNTREDSFYITLLKRLYGGFGVHGLKNDDAIINIWRAQNSNDIRLIIYYYVTEMYFAFRNKKEQLLEYYVSALEDILLSREIMEEINVKAFAEMINKSVQEQQEYYYQEYIKYSLANSEFALLYRNLYNYVVISNMDLTDDMINKSGDINEKKSR